MATVVVVPCHNEASRLARDEFISFARRSQTRLLFVNDGSTDATDRILQEMATVTPDRIDVMHLSVRSGKGGAVRAGLRAAIAQEAQVVGYLDADLSTPLEELERLLAIRQETGADGVLGSRVGLLGHDINRSPARHYLGRVFATAASLVLDLRIYDTQCGAKVFRVCPELEQALAPPFRTRWVFDVELLARLRQANPAIRLLEVPLSRWHDIAGSKLTGMDMVIAAWDLALIARSRKRQPVADNLNSLPT